MGFSLKAKWVKLLFPVLWIAWAIVWIIGGGFGFIQYFASSHIGSLNPEVTAGLTGIALVPSAICLLGAIVVAAALPILWLVFLLFEIEKDHSKHNLKIRIVSLVLLWFSLKPSLTYYLDFQILLSQYLVWLALIIWVLMIHPPIITKKLTRLYRALNTV